VVLVCDDLHNAADGDLALLARLLEASRPDRLRVVLIGRPGGRWPATGEIAQVEVPPFEEDESGELADLLLGTMSIPSPVRNRFLAAAAGNPFFFEEGLVGLMRRKLMRQSYGNFFFSGDEATAYEPSQRLIQHAEAEAGRLGDARALRLLALGGAALPAAEVRSAVAVLEPEAPLGGDWDRPYLAAGVLAETDSPWGAGVYLRYPALAAALASTLPDGEAPRVRQLLGELLAGRSEDAAGRWHRYRLLAGSPEAVELALRLARDPGLGAAGIGDRELLEALDAERAALRGRGGDGRADLELTLARSRIACRLARLEGVAEDLARALALAPEGGVPPATRFAAAQLKAEIDRLSGRLQQAEQTLEATLRESAGIDEASKAALLVDLARVLMEQQRHDEAEKILGRILSSIPPDEPSELAASCRFYLGSVAMRRRAAEAALTHHREAPAARRRLGSEPQALTASLTALGGVSLELGRYSVALDSSREAEQTARELDDDLELAFVLLGLGRVLGRLGDFAAASAPLRQALALREGSGDALGEAIAGLAVAESYLDLDRPREALRAAREAHFRLTLLGEGAPLGRAERILGRILLGRSHEPARAHLLRALELHQASGDRLAAAFDRAWLLEAAAAGGHVDEVRQHGAALAEFFESADYPEQGEQLDYRLFKALWWLREQGEKGGDALVHLKRAYRELLRKAGHLDPDLRQRFLSQIPANQAIITAATRHRLTG
jgi:tetratricopeptide (TPR) repeat protein